MHKASRFAALAALAALAMAIAPSAGATCTSDGRRAPVALLERFINADCADCWADRKAPAAATGTLALDWIVPGSRGEDAPLSAAAVRDARDRLVALREQAPAQTLARHAKVQALGKLRVAMGLPFNDYIGTSIEWRGASGEGPWTAWVVLVESVAAGTEGSPVARHLVRNALELQWRPGTALRESRVMRIPEGAHPDRLAVIGWVEDARGTVSAIARTHCPR